MLKFSCKWLFLKYLMQYLVPYSSWKQPSDRSKCWKIHLDSDRAIRGLQLTQQCCQQGGLACPHLPHHSQQGALGHAELYAVGKRAATFYIHFLERKWLE